MSFAGRILNDKQKVLVEASTMHACTSVDDKLRRVPEELVLKLRPYVAETTP